MSKSLSSVARYTIILIDHDSAMTDSKAVFKDFSLLLRADRVDAVVSELEAKHNMRCCVLCNEG